MTRRYARCLTNLTVSLKETAVPLHCIENFCNKGTCKMCYFASVCVCWGVEFLDLLWFV